MAGVTIGAITGNNGLINQAGQAKEDVEIANEKEVIENATVSAMGKNKYGNLKEDEFQEALDKQTGEGKTTVTDVGEAFEVYFIESKRYYEVDIDGNIGDYTLGVTDPYPGDITKDENGNDLDGSEANPYQINCIEDLVAFSNMTNGTGVMFENGTIKEITIINAFVNQYIVVTRDLNFKSNASYVNSQRKDFEDINENGENETLIIELTTGKGFKPIASYKSGETYVMKFLGHFNETSEKIVNIKNLFINRENETVGLFGYISENVNVGAEEITIQNLAITGNVTGSNAGGLVGSVTLDNVDAKIENCINQATINGKGGAGGIIGSKSSSLKNLNINNCKNNGKVTSPGEHSGGIIGYAQNNVSILNCSNLQTIEQTGSGTGYNGAGGITAFSGANVNILNSYNQGKIISNYNTGGIIGFARWAQRYIINCYNTGEVTGVSVGGLVGKIESSNEILNTKNCYYLNTNISKAIGNWNTTQESQEDITGKSESELKSEEILNAFNGIEESTDYDITTFKRWKAGENGYPEFQ